MSELGGLDIGLPDEGGSGASEQLSEQAKERFAANVKAMQQIKKEEKKSKKKDDQVVQVIIQFLGEDKYSHLFVLISRLVARNCPSIFILSILSLIHEEARKEVKKYLEDNYNTSAEKLVDDSMALTKNGTLDSENNELIVDWITRMQMVLALHPEKILLTLMIDEKNIDGTLLQLATFTMQEFFKSLDRTAPFEKIQPLTASILQTVLEPFIGKVQKLMLESKQSEVDEEDED